MRVLASVTSALTVLLFSATLQADPEVGQLREHLAEHYPEFTVDSIESTPLKGVYEIVSGTQVIYMSGDGRYMLRGELLDLEAERNLTSEVENRLHHARVAKLDDGGFLVYEPSGRDAEHTVTVFTDVTCGYCRTLHREILEVLDDHGIRLRYLMFPRAGVDSSAADTLRDVWCADDPQAAMTAAKAGESVPARSGDCEPPVAEHFQAAREIGVSGTPYMLLGEDGPVFAGYRPPERLLAMLGATGPAE